MEELQWDNITKHRTEKTMENGAGSIENMIQTTEHG